MRDVIGWARDAINAKITSNNAKKPQRRAITIVDNNVDNNIILNWWEEIM